MIECGSVVRLKKEYVDKYNKGIIFCNNDFVVIDNLDRNCCLVENNELKIRGVIFEKELEIICDVAEDKDLKMIEENHVPFLDGRPDRDTVINSDDILNLNIAVNTVSTFKEFFQLV